MQIMKKEESVDLELIDRYLKKWGIPVKTDHNTKFSVSLKYHVYISLISVMITCIKYLILITTENEMISIALSNQFRYHQKENFFFCLVATILNGSAVGEKLLMIKYQNNKQMVIWTEIFRDSSNFSHFLRTQAQGNASKRVRKWCAKNFKRCHKIILIMSAYYVLWAFITHLVCNDILYVLTIDLIWSFLWAFGIFFFLAQFFVIVISVILIFYYYDTCLNEIFADINISKVENNSSKPKRIKSIRKVMSILCQYNFQLNFIHECNNYWKNLIGIVVLFTILCVGVAVAILGRVDEGAKLVTLLTILLMVIFCFPFFFLGARNFNKVAKLRRKVFSLALTEVPAHVAIKIQDQTYEQGHRGVFTVFDTAPLSSYGLVITLFEIACNSMMAQLALQ
ncbi:uncharacterized protein LOC141852397 [Brevipalpus obovatus]|uniref:uncharacterized protein LOC141852397 n=1 Tax=Brevipalpus obovatus TaxID=246614 RepID=UPI003D9EE564